MDRSKLEYLLKNLSIKDKNEIIVEIDPDGDYAFGFLVKKFLKNPDSNDPFVLLALPDPDDPACIEAFKQKYVKQFEKINALCIKHKIYPFFDNPQDLPASELKREDLCCQVHESWINEFFGVESFYDYNPPVYEPEE